jgi:hypothetical protein
VPGRGLPSVYTAGSSCGSVSLPARPRDHVLLGLDQRQTGKARWDGGGRPQLRAVPGHLARPPQYTGEAPRPAAPRGRSASLAPIGAAAAH